MLCTLVDNFYLTDEELQNSPSRKDGIDEETETTLRIYGAQLIQEATILLKCPQAVAASGQVLLQRFYCQRSFKQYNVKKLAAAALYLSTKLEECTTIRCRDVLMVIDRLWRRKDGRNLRLLEPASTEYHKAKEAIIRYERDLLAVFGFIVHCDPPHKLLISLLNMLEASDAMFLEAWNIANDSLRTTLCVRFKSEVIASGVIFYAARRLQAPLPESVNTLDGVMRWWEVFGVPTAQLREVVLALHQLYQRPKAQYVDVDAPLPGPSRPAMSEAMDVSTAGPSPTPVPASSQVAAAAADTSRLQPREGFSLGVVQEEVTQTGGGTGAVAGGAGGGGGQEEVNEAASTAHQNGGAAVGDAGAEGASPSSKQPEAAPAASHPRAGGGGRGETSSRRGGRSRSRSRSPRRTSKRSSPERSSRRGGSRSPNRRKRSSRSRSRDRGSRQYDRDSRDSRDHRRGGDRERGSDRERRDKDRLSSRDREYDRDRRDREKERDRGRRPPRDSAARDTSRGGSRQGDDEAAARDGGCLSSAGATSQAPSDSRGPAGGLGSGGRSSRRPSLAALQEEGEADVEMRQAEQAGDEGGGGGGDRMDASEPEAAVDEDQRAAQDTGSR